VLQLVRAYGELVNQKANADLDSAHYGDTVTGGHHVMRFLWTTWLTDINVAS
jgi:hypothetical protein